MTLLPCVCKLAWDKSQKRGRWTSLSFTWQLQTPTTTTTTTTTTSTTTTSPWRQFHIDLHRSREILLLSAQLFPWVFGVRCWGFAEFQGLHCPEEAAHQHWRAASEFTCVPLPSSHRDSRQQWRGPPHCSPLISTNEFLCGKEQTALQ